MNSTSSRLAGMALALAHPLALALGGIAALSACGDDLPSPAVVANLRVLAVRADPPEGVIGTDVTLDALVVAPDLTVDAQHAWIACVAANGTSPIACAMGGDVTMPALCSDAPEASLCLIGADAAVTYRLPAAARVGRGPTDDGVVVVTLITAAAADGGTVGCVNELAATGQPPDWCRIAVKQLAVRPDGTAVVNGNPTLTSLAAAPDGALTATLAADAVEQTPNGAEELYYSWFVTGGELERFRTDGENGLANTWTLPTEPGTYRAAVVVRDGRGGESWATADVVVP